jgi:hypothetical protein
MEVESGEALGEAPVRVGTQLRQQEPGASIQFPRRVSPSAAAMSGHFVSHTS